MKRLSTRSRQSVPGKRDSLALPCAAAPAPIYRAPFFHTEYLGSIKEASDSIRNKFIAECLQSYDSDKKGAVAISELIILTKDLYETLGMPAPKESLAADVCKRELGDAALENGPISGKEFESFLLSLLKGALFKAKIAGTESRKSEDGAGEKLSARPSVSRKSVSQSGTPSECDGFPIGTQVMVMSFSRCFVKYAAGAKRLGLTSFEPDLFPPRTGLTVVGSYQFQGKNSGEETILLDTYIVGVVDGDGKGYLVDSEGLQAADLQVFDTPGNVLARAEAIELGTCLTVRQRLKEAAEGAFTLRRSSTRSLESME